MAKKMKNFLSLVLVFSMLMSLFSISAYAEDGLAEGNGAAAVVPANQEKQVVTSQKDVVVNGQKVSISKSLEGTDIENVFDITLKATTETVIDELYKDPDIAVAIVMDISGSMLLAPVDANGMVVEDDNLQYTQAVNAAKAFISSFCESSRGLDACRELSLISFNTDGKVQQGLTDCTNATIDNFTSAFTSMDQSVGYSSTPLKNDKGEESHYPDSYKRSSSSRYTNIEAGLKLGQNVLNQSKAEHKFMILLTDGFPTTYYAGHNSSSTTGITGYKPDSSVGTIGDDGYFYDALTRTKCIYGTSYSDKGAKYAKTVADQIDEDSITVFTVGINIGGQNISSMVRDGSYSVVDCFATENAAGAYTATEPDAKGRIYITSDDSSYLVGNNAGAYEDWLKNNISTKPSYYSNGDDLTALYKAYADFTDTINTTIENASKAKWVVSDPMGANVEFIQFFDKSNALSDASLTGSSGEGAENTASYSYGINWDLKKSGYTSETVNNVTTYTYTLKYRVRLQTEETGFVEGATVETNGTTKLGYQWKETVNGVDKFVDKPDLEFPKPSVKGYLGELSFTKKVADKEDILAGAGFTLSHNGDECSVCKAIGKTVAISNQTATSDQNGLVSFTKIPSGHEYTLSETTVPAGYEKAADKQVVVAYGETKVDGKVAAEFTAVENKKLNNLVIKKDVVFTSTGDNSTTAEESRVYAEKAYTIQIVKKDGSYENTVQLPVKDASGNLVWEVKLENLTSGEYTITEIGENILANYGYTHKKPITVDDKTIESVEVDNGDTIAVDVTNIYTYSPDNKTIKAYKVWNDANNQDGFRPYAVAFALFVNNQQIGDKQMVTYDEATDTFHTTFVYDGRQHSGEAEIREVGYYTDAITYVEGAVPRYNVSEAATGTEEISEGITVDTATITNIHAPEEVTFDVTKVWANGTEGKEQDVTVRLLADGIEVNRAVLTKDTQWAARFTTLADGTTPLYQYKDNGVEIKYTLTEDKLGYNWYSKIEESANGWVVTNSYSAPPTTTFVSVNKVWNDDNNADTKRPESISVQLLKNGEIYDTRALSAVTGWRTGWYGLERGYTWTVKEVVPEGYISEVTGTDTSFTITNTYIPEHQPLPPTEIDDQDPPTGNKEINDPLYDLDDGDVPQDYLEVGDPDVPKTDDGSNVNIWLLIALLSGAALIASVAAERRQDKHSA